MSESQRPPPPRDGVGATRGRVTRLDSALFPYHAGEAAFIALGVPLVGGRPGDMSTIIDDSVNKLEQMQSLPLGMVYRAVNKRNMYKQPWCSTVASIKDDVLLDISKSLKQDLEQNKRIEPVHAAQNGHDLRVNVYARGGWLDAHRHGPTASFMLEGGVGHSGHLADVASGIQTVHVTVCWQARGVRHLILQVCPDVLWTHDLTISP